VREAVSVVGIAATTLPMPTQMGSRLGLTPLETPASVFILPGDAIRERGAPTLVDAKARAVGVTMQGNPGNGYNGLAARGFVDTGSVMQLFDGELMLVGASTVTFPFDPWMVERIEVLGGPASVLYGNGAIGGVVNVVPRRPNPSLEETAIRLGAGSFNTWRGALGTAGSIGTSTSYRLDFSGNRSSGWLKGNRSDTTAFSASLRHQFRPNLSVTLAEDFGYQRPGEYFGSPTIDGEVDASRRDVNYNVADSEIWFRDSWTQAKVEWQPSPNVQVRNGLRVLAAGRHFRDVEQYVFNPLSNQIDRDSYFEAFHRQRQYGDRTEIVVSSRPLGRSNTLSAGLDYNFVSFQHTNNSPYGGSSVTDLDNATPGQFINLAGTLPKYRTHTNQVAFFAEDRFAVTPNLSLVGGLRLDRYAVERRNLLDDTTVDRTYTPPSWRGGAVYSVKPGLSLYGQVATATDTIRNVISSNPGQLLFDPTIGRQVEGGVKQSLRDQRVEWTAAGYYISKTKLIAPVPGRPGVVQQIGSQSSRGVEATAVINLPVGLRIEGNLAVLDARFDDFAEAIAGVLVSRAGNTPPSVPERAVNLWLTWNAPQAWQFRGGLRSVGRRYWDNANAFSIPAYTVVDAGIRKRLTGRVAVDLYLYNLTNELYATDFYFNAFAPQWMLGAPRSAEMALTLGF
jgi:iron complex outermembrane receptor protein